MVKNIFFDFDGVIAESVNVKTAAFAKLYEPHGELVVQQVVDHHMANGGMSRFEKFKHYHKEFLNIDLDKKGIDEKAQEFSELVKQGVIDAPEVPGAHNFLSEFKDAYQMFIITGTPTDESKEICKARGIEKCLKGIYGSPQKKDYWSNFILNEFGLSPSETIFVGDALADYYAALNTNLKFYLREYDENIHLFNDFKEIIRFKNFDEFRELIK